MSNPAPDTEYDEPVVTTKTSTTAMLSTMMFLEFFIWGAWFVTIGTYLSKGVDYAAGIETAYSVGPIAAIISPLFLGLFADRYFQSRHVLAGCHLVGAALMFIVPWSIGEEIANKNGMFFWVLLAYALAYYPTLGITNTIAMQNIQDAKKQFPVIRVFGTIGWIIAGVIVGTILKADEKALPMYIAAGASVALGVFSFFLPGNKPIPSTEASLGKRVAQLLGLEAFTLFKDKNFFVFALISLLLCIPLQAYYAYAATFITDTGKFSSASGIMIWGQMSEIVFMLLIPFFFKRLGVKWMIGVGIGCWVLRYGLFALGAPEAVSILVFGGILVHGICYDFFFVTGQIYTDDKAPKAIRGQAQGLLVVLTQGVGMFIGAKINGKLFLDTVNAEEPTALLGQWQSFWMYLGAASAVLLVLFLAIFREKRSA